MNVEERIKYMKNVVYSSDSERSSAIMVDGFGFRVVYLTKPQRRVTGYSHIIVPFDIDSVHAIRAVHAENEVDVNDTIMTDGGVVFARIENMVLKVVTPSIVIVNSQRNATTPEDMVVLDDLCEMVYALCEDR